MAFLLKRRDGWDIAKKKRYCPVQNGTYGQPILAGLKVVVFLIFTEIPNCNCD
jgi:hypothetical protein